MWDEWTSWEQLCGGGGWAGVRELRETWGRPPGTLTPSAETFPPEGAGQEGSMASAWAMNLGRYGEGGHFSRTAGDAKAPIRVMGGWERRDP